MSKQRLHIESIPVSEDEEACDIGDERIPNERDGLLSTKAK